MSSDSSAGRLRQIWSGALERAGGAQRARQVVLLAAVLGLNSADLATIGAVAAELEHGLRIGDLQVGIAASVVSLAAAVATLPVGWLTDRVRRVPLLAGSIALWSVAMLGTGAATSFTMLLVSRVFLGAVQATSGPTLAALTGDLFPARERSRIFGAVHAGELIGGGFGFVMSGEVAAVLSWRWSFWLLAAPGFLLALAVWRWLPEPKRRGRREREPAVSRLLKIPTNLILIVSMSFGYFFLGGAQTFGVILFRGHYRLGQATATATSAVLGIGALAGVIAAGRLADRLLARGRRNARIVVSAAGDLAAVALFVPALLTSNLALALPLLVLAAGALMAQSGPLDAALLDVIPRPLWGRAEGLQTAARTLAMALAPVLFGVAADVFGGHSSGTLGQGAVGGGATAGAAGIQATFLVMLVPIVLAGLTLLRALRTYPRDVDARKGAE